MSADATGEHVAEADDPHRAAEATARILCLRQLDVRARTRTELSRYLNRKGVPTEAAERVLDRFTEIGLINDQALAESYVVSRHDAHGLARRALAVKLRQRGVNDAVIESAVDLVDPAGELAAARALVERRRRSVARLAPDVQVRRLAAFLARKGYSAGLSYRVVRESVEMWSETSDPSPPGPVDATTANGPGRRARLSKVRSSAPRPAAGPP